MIVIARIPAVTRTIETIRVTIICLDLAEKASFEKILRLPAWYDTDSKILRVTKELLPISQKPVSVLDVQRLGKVNYTLPEYLYIQSAAIKD